MLKHSSGNKDYEKPSLGNNFASSNQPHTKNQKLVSKLAAKRTAHSNNVDQMALIAIQAAVDQKSLDVKGLNVSECTNIADCFVIASGTSERHVRGIADKVKQALRLAGEDEITVSGYEEGQWILLDCGDLVVHIFYEPVRQYYLFDKLWEAGKALEVSDALREQMRFLRTGMYK